MSYNSRIILAKIATYYSQNYAGTLGASLSACAQSVLHIKSLPIMVVLCSMLLPKLCWQNWVSPAY